MRSTALSLFALCALLGLVNYSFAQTVDSCLSLEGIIGVSRLQQELEKADIPYRTDPKVICVTQDHRENFYRVVREVFPPEPYVSRRIKVPLSPSGIPLQSSTLTDPVQHKMLQEELERKKIWYTIDETGALWYEVTNEKQVSELIFSIIASDIPVGRSVHYAQPFARELFKAELTRNGVPYESKIRRNEEWIVWKDADTARVKTIQEFVSDETIKHVKKQLESRKGNQSN